MRRYLSITIIAFAIGSLIFTGCEKDPENNSPAIEKANEINTFIWSGLHDVYLWNKNVPELTSTYYNTNEDSLNSFLNRYTNPEDLFYDLLYDYGKTDKFSWIVDDYEVLEKEFQGISKTFGYNFMPASYDSNRVFAYVRYVVKGSPAALAGLKRGDLISIINDQQLTVQNYRTLLYGTESQKVAFADIVDKSLVPNGRTTSMTAVELTENPIYLDTVYTVDSHKIGYLVYNSFTSTFDKELNNVFLKFKNAGVSKLIVDLRYNLGGSLESSTYLASMIYGTQTNKVFLKTKFNDLMQNYYDKEYGENYFDVNFESDITRNNIKTPINTLSLTEVYIITSNHTASASESIINGLKPYMNVVTVGTRTLGKYVGSITVKDIIDTKGTVNPNHKWAMQPIVLKVANSAGESDYVNGLAPQITIDENVRNLSTLGDLNEPLLKTTLSAITGTTSKSASMPDGIQKLQIPNMERKSEMYFHRPEKFLK
jgi:C-terminal processing protease CtpA/Prc